MAFRWDKDCGLSFNGVFRAGQDYLIQVSQSTVQPPQVKMHESNPDKVIPSLWWRAQLTLYGLEVDDSTTIRQARLAFQELAQKHGSLPVAKTIVDREARMRKSANAVSSRTRSGTQENTTVPENPTAWNESPQNNLKRTAEAPLEPPAKRLATAVPSNHGYQSVPRTPRLRNDTVSIQVDTLSADTSASCPQESAEELGRSNIATATERPAKESPHRPSVIAERVKFFPFGDKDWMVEYEDGSMRYAVRDADDIDFLINDWLCTDVPFIQDPVSRACRWLDDDQPLSFYLAQLQFRNLPLTRSKETAKWRLRTAGRDADKSHISPRLRNIFGQLEKLLDKMLSDSSEDRIPNPRIIARDIEDIPMAPDVTINARKATIARSSEDYSIQIGELQPWMKEHFQSVSNKQRAFDSVLRRWLVVRTQLRHIEDQASLHQEAHSEPRLRPDHCEKCSEKLRFCNCECCKECGELCEECRCHICSDCGQDSRNACRCLVCYKCEMKVDRRGDHSKAFCFCCCNECGGFLEIDNSTRCTCGLSEIAKFTKLQELSKRRSQHLNSPNRRSWASEFRNKIRGWVSVHLKAYYDERPRLLHSIYSALSIYTVRGTYEILSSFSSNIKCREKSEIVISADTDALYGRYRFASDLTGLFRTNRLPKAASTEFVQCKWAIENYATKNGKWLSSANLGGVQQNDTDTTDGIMFLGNGLIKISPNLLWHQTARNYGDVIFGIRVSSYCEDVEAMKESWLAIHKDLCWCGGDGGSHGWRPFEEPAAPPWDEDAVDRYVCRLDLPRHGECSKIEPM